MQGGEMSGKVLLNFRTGGGCVSLATDSEAADAARLTSRSLFSSLVPSWNDANSPGWSKCGVIPGAAPSERLPGEPGLPRLPLLARRLRLPRLVPAQVVPGGGLLASPPPLLCQVNCPLLSQWMGKKGRVTLKWGLPDPGLGELQGLLHPLFSSQGCRLPLPHPTRKAAFVFLGGFFELS